MPVIRRRLAVELLEMLDFLGTAAVTSGRSVAWGPRYPSRKAYNAATYRLRKRGLVAYRREGAKDPVMHLTARGEARLPDICRPQKFWNRKWKGIWYLLAYDVPESNRGYRNTLRTFLKRMRMGYLQDSVWVSPDDIRPEFSDLTEAAAVGDFAFLFEARTVLGLPAEQVVRSAWDMDRLQQAHEWFCEVCKETLRKVTSGQFAGRTPTDLAREAASAYATVMEHDPLLPRSLWPSGYQGEQAHRLHRRLQQEIARRH